MVYRLGLFAGSDIDQIAGDEITAPGQVDKSPLGIKPGPRGGFELK